MPLNKSWMFSNRRGTALLLVIGFLTMAFMFGAALLMSMRSSRTARAMQQAHVELYYTALAGAENVYHKLKTAPHEHRYYLPDSEETFEGLFGRGRFVVMAKDAGKNSILIQSTGYIEKRWMTVEFTAVFERERQGRLVREWWRMVRGTI